MPTMSSPRAKLTTPVPPSPLSSTVGTPRSGATPAQLLLQKAQTAGLPQQPGEIALAAMLNAATVARTDSLRAEKQWTQLVEKSVKALGAAISPKVVAVCREFATILAESCVRVTTGLRNALQPIERLPFLWGELHAADLDSLGATLRAQHDTEVASLKDEVRTLDALVQALTAERDERDAKIATLEAAYAQVQEARRVDALQLRALVPDEGFELVHTDDAAFDAQVAAKVAYLRQAQDRTIDTSAGAFLDPGDVQNLTTLGGGEGAQIGTMAAARAAHAVLARTVEAPKAIRIWRRQESSKAAVPLRSASFRQVHIEKKIPTTSTK